MQTLQAMQVHVNVLLMTWVRTKNISLSRVKKIKNKKMGKIKAHYGKR